jgi:hypothetical protein
VHLVDGTTSSSLSSLHRLARSDVLSDVPSVPGRDGSQVKPSQYSMCVVRTRHRNQGDESLQPLLRLMPDLVLENNLLHVRTNASCFQLF